MKPSYLFVSLSHLIDREVILGHLNRNQYNKSYNYSNKFKVNHISWFSHSSKMFQIVSLCILLNQYDTSLMNQSMAKQAKWPVHPVKAQISLGVCPVRSWASVQSYPSLQYPSWVAKTPSSWRQQRLWSDWVDAQTDLSLCWMHIILLVMIFVMLWLKFCSNDTRQALVYNILSKKDLCFCLTQTSELLSFQKQTFIWNDLDLMQVPSGFRHIKNWQLDARVVNIMLLQKAVHVI